MFVDISHDLVYFNLMKRISDIETEFGGAIRQARIKKGLTLEDVAAKANLSPTSVRSLELGRGSSLTTLLKALSAIDELGFIEEWIEIGNGFSPIAMYRESKGKARKPMRVPAKKRK
jgi:transcriptional regulator with XRE-family HTH domain